MLLTPVAAYALAILLRVACHFCGVEIPALGRAFGTVAATGGLTILAFVIFQATLVGWDAERTPLVPQFLALLLSLAFHVVVTISLYIVMLETRFGKALSIWLAQAALFAAIALLGGCCVGVPAMLLDW